MEVNFSTDRGRGGREMVLGLLKHIHLLYILFLLLLHCNI